MKQACYILFIALWFTIPLQLVAQNDEPRRLSGVIVDAVTDEYVRASVDLLDTDSNVVSKAEVLYYVSDNGYKEWEYRVQVPHQGKYILRSTPESTLYSVRYKNVDITYGNREFQLPNVNIDMRRRFYTTDVQLDSVFVTATKVKFYFDKDTLIYDATAFDMRESAVLKDLIDQLPGVELHADGEIVANGLHVDALLLNGKDFFNENRTTILNNLPHYMISKVKVHSKTPDATSKIARERTYNGYVMDVRLKKQYETTWLANFALGYGTDSHYSAKTFLMRFNKNYSVSGNLMSDDVSDSRYASRSGEGFVVTSGQSLNPYEITSATLDYNYDHPEGAVALKGWINMAYTDITSFSMTKTQSFYSDGDIFSRFGSMGKNYRVALSTDNTWDLFTLSPWRIEISPHINYTLEHSHNESVSAEFTTDVAESWGSEWLDTLRNARLYRLSQLNAINRRSLRGKNDNEQLNAFVRLSKNIRIPHTDDVLSFAMQLRHDTRNYKAFSRDKVEYISRLDNDVRNNYNSDNTSNQSMNFTSSYLYVPNPRMSVNVNYSLDYRHEKANRDLYLLNLLGEEWKDDNAPLGTLPSEELLFQVIDAFNSSNTKTVDWIHHPRVTVNYSLKKKPENQRYEREWLSIELGLPLTMQHNSLDYHSVQADTSIHRSVLLFEPSLAFRMTNLKSSSTMSVRVLCSQSPVSMTRLINVVNTSNPLYISRNNPELKTITSYWHYSLNLSSGNIRGFKNATLSASYSRGHNGIGTESVYDKSTGVTTTRPVNINGNWSTKVSLQKRVYIRGKRLSLECTPNLGWTYSNNVGIYNIHSTHEPQFSEVHTNVILFYMSSKYNWNKNNSGSYVNFRPDVTLTRSTSSRPDFETITTGDVGLNVQLTCRFKNNWSCQWYSTLYSHFGYRYSDMNKTTLLSNFEVQKDIRQSTISLIAYDIFHSTRFSQISVGPQSRSESYNKWQGQYFMVRWLYRLSKKKDA